MKINISRHSLSLAVPDIVQANVLLNLLLRTLLAVPLGDAEGQRELLRCQLVRFGVVFPLWNAVNLLARRVALLDHELDEFA